MNRAPHFNRRRGFTLVELLIVLSLMGIIAAAAIPSASPSVREQLFSTAQVIASDLEFARSLALTNNSTYEITFSVNRNRYVIEHSGANAALDDLPHTPYHDSDDPDDQYIVRLNNLPQLGISAQLAAIYAVSSVSTPVATIEFDELGATTRSEASVIWLAAGSGTARRYLSIRVNPATGLTWIENYQTTMPSAALPIASP